MWLSSSSKKVLWSKSQTKKTAVPIPGFIQTECHKKYCKWAKEDNYLSFKEWLREFDKNSNKPKRYKDGSTLVGMQMRSAFTDVYFYQDLIMRKRHRNVQELLHPNHNELPTQIRHFAAAWMYRPELWQNLTKFNTNSL